MLQGVSLYQDMFVRPKKNAYLLTYPLSFCGYLFGVESIGGSNESLKIVHFPAA